MKSRALPLTVLLDANGSMIRWELRSGPPTPIYDTELGSFDHDARQLAFRHTIMIGSVSAHGTATGGQETLPAVTGSPQPSIDGLVTKSRIKTLAGGVS